MKHPHKPLPAPTPELIEAFLAKVDKRICWLWTGARNNGYGDFRGYKAHRLSAHWFNGPFPAEHVVIHRDHCQPHCVRPDHLQAVTVRAGGQRAYGVTLRWRGALGRREEPVCACWGPDGQALAGCPIPGHVRVTPERRIREDGLKVGDVVPIRYVEMFQRMPRCPQCVKTVRLGTPTECRWCGIGLVVEDDNFLVVRAPDRGRY